MRRLFDSMASRVFVALVAGILIATVISLGLALSERQRMIGQFREFHAIERIIQFVLSMENVSTDLRPQFLIAAQNIGMRAEMADDPSPSINSVPRWRNW